MTDTTKLNPLIEQLITLAITALILIKLSGNEHLGVVQVLLLALAIPLIWGMHHVIHRKEHNLFAVSGMPCVLLTRARQPATHSIQTTD